MASKTEVAAQQITDADLREMKTFADAIDALSAVGVATRKISAYGDGFSVADKAQMVGKPFVIIQHRFVDGDMGQFVVLHVMTEGDEKCIIVDGSTGILRQVHALEDQGVDLRALFVENGLTRSDYTYTDSVGEPRPATTYYLADL